eukprot:2602744-Prymnesium_polylepis.1
MASFIVHRIAVLRLRVICLRGYYTGTQEGRCLIRVSRHVSPDQWIGHIDSTHASKMDTNGLTDAHCTRARTDERKSPW